MLHNLSMALHIFSKVSESPLLLVPFGIVDGALMLTIYAKWLGLAVKGNNKKGVTMKTMWSMLVLPGSHGGCHLIIVTKYKCVFLLQGQGDSKVFVAISQCMVVRAFPLQRETLYGGVLRWF